MVAPPKYRTGYPRMNEPLSRHLRAGGGVHSDLSETCSQGHHNNIIFYKFSMQSIFFLNLMSASKKATNQPYPQSDELFLGVPTSKPSPPNTGPTGKGHPRRGWVEMGGATFGSHQIGPNATRKSDRRAGGNRLRWCRSRTRRAQAAGSRLGLLL